MTRIRFEGFSRASQYQGLISRLGELSAPYRSSPRNKSNVSPPWGVSTECHVLREAGNVITARARFAVPLPPAREARGREGLGVAGHHRHGARLHFIHRSTLPANGRQVAPPQSCQG